MKKVFLLLLPAVAALPASAQEPFLNRLQKRDASVWQTSVEAGVAFVGVGNVKRLPAGESLNNGYADANPALVVRIGRQWGAGSPWRAGVRAEITSWQVNKGKPRLNAQSGLYTGEGATYLAWPALSLGPTVYRRLLSAGRSQVGISLYGGIAWASGRKPAFYANGLTNRYFSSSTGFCAGAELHYQYALSGRLLVVGSGGVQRSWMTLTDQSDGGFRLNCLGATLGAGYRF